MKNLRLPAKGRIVRYVLHEGHDGTRPAQIVRVREDARVDLRVTLAAPEDAQRLFQLHPPVAWLESGVPLLCGVDMGHKPGFWRWPPHLAARQVVRHDWRGEECRKCGASRSSSKGQEECLVREVPAPLPTGEDLAK